MGSSTTKHDKSKKRVGGQAEAKDEVKREELVC